MRKYMFICNNFSYYGQHEQKNILITDLLGKDMLKIAKLYSTFTLEEIAIIGEQVLTIYKFYSSAQILKKCNYHSLCPKSNIYTVKTFYIEILKYEKTNKFFFYIKYIYLFFYFLFTI